MSMICPELQAISDKFEIIKSATDKYEGETAIDNYTLVLVHNHFFQKNKISASHFNKNRTKLNQEQIEIATKKANATIEVIKDAKNKFYKQQQEQSDLKKKENYPELTEELEKLVELKLVGNEKNTEVIRLANKPAIANYIIDFFDIVNIKGNLYIKKDGIYLPDDLSDNIFTKNKIYELLEKLNLTDKSNYVKLVEDITKAIEMKNPLTKSPFNQEICIINCKNGLLKLDFDKRTTELIPHTEKNNYKFTYQLPINYDGKISTDFAKKFFMQFNIEGKSGVPISMLLAQPGAQIIIQRSFPDINFKLLIHIFHAGTHRGKTSIIMHYYKVFGKDNISNVALDQMADRFQPSAMYGKIANIHDDLPNKPIPNDRLKNITGGAETQIEFKGKTPFSAKMNMAHIYTVNKVPRLMNMDEALYGRMSYVHLEKQFKVNPNFERDISEEESQSMLNYFIEFAFDIYARGNQLYGEDTWKELRKQSYLDNNLIHKFIMDYLIKTNNDADIVTRREFNEEFKRVCEEEYFCSPDDIPDPRKVGKYMEDNNFIHNSGNDDKKETINGRQERCFYKLSWKDDSKNIPRVIKTIQKNFEKENFRKIESDQETLINA